MIVYFSVNAYKSYFVIKEFYRLVPYKMDPYVKFHALNMPDVKIHSVAFVGTVIFIRTRAKNKYFIFTGKLIHDKYLFEN